MVERFGMKLKQMQSVNAGHERCVFCCNCIWRLSVPERRDHVINTGVKIENLIQARALNHWQFNQILEKGNCWRGLL